MSIRGRVDVYCTESKQSFIAVASSTEQNHPGRPTVVRIVEFMATDPLYKATQIGAFGDFEFRATELHDDIMTLAQVQQLWNQVPTDARWWPVKPYGSIPFRAAELIYATLGPMATHELLQSLLSSPNEKSQSTQRLIEGLEQALGRRPAMLLALTASLGAAQRYELRGLDVLDYERSSSSVDRFLGEALKHLGGLVLEAAQQFGLDEDEFGPWFESQTYDLFDQSQWPPTQVAYTLEGPESPGSQLDWPVEILEIVRGPFSDEPDSGANPMVSPERLTILSRLQAESDIAWAIGGHAGNGRVLTRDEARAWARLVAGTVQAWHDNLANPEVRLTSPYADDMFTYNLLESICAVPRESWTKLTDARRICLIADLGELLMVISELSGGDITNRAAGALGLVCDYDDELITIGEQAGLALPYRDGALEFDIGIGSIRGFQPFD